MKRNTFIVVFILIFFLLINCLIQILSLRDQISSLQSNLNSQISDVNGSVQDIYSNVDDLLKKEASLLSEARWEYGDVDLEAKTVTLKCSVTAKEYSPDRTQASLTCGEEAYPMTLKNGTFTAEIPLPLFSSADVFHVVFADDDVRRTENLGWSFSPRYDFLPNVSAQYSGSMTSRGDGYQRKGEVYVDVDTGAPAEIRSITLVETLDGKIKGTKEMELEEPKGDYYWHASCPIDKTYKIPAGSVQELYVEVVDGYGLHYRTLVDRWTGYEGTGESASAEESATSIEEGWEIYTTEIYDAEGNLLYKE